MRPWDFAQANAVTNYWAALQSNAQSKNRGRLVCTAKRQNGGRIRFSAPLPPPPPLLPNFGFLRGRGGSFQIKIMVGEQWIKNSKLLLRLMIRARKLLVSWIPFRIVIKPMWDFSVLYYYWCSVRGPGDTAIYGLYWYVPMRRVWFSSSLPWVWYWRIWA